MGKKVWILTGKIVSGTQKAAYFTELDWVQKQCMEKLGFRPYPGTLNLKINTDSVVDFKQLQDKEGQKLIPPDPEFCAAGIWPVSIGSEKAAIIMPAEDVRVHGEQIVEVIAPFRVKDKFGLNDGDPLTVRIDDSGV